MKTQIIQLSLPDDNDDNYDNDQQKSNNNYKYSNNPGLVAMVDVLKVLFTYMCGPYFTSMVITNCII